MATERYHSRGTEGWANAMMSVPIDTLIDLRDRLNGAIDCLTGTQTKQPANPTKSTGYLAKPFPARSVPVRTAAGKLTTARKQLATIKRELASISTVAKTASLPSLTGLWKGSSYADVAEHLIGKLGHDVQAPMIAAAVSKLRRKKVPASRIYGTLDRSKRLQKTAPNTFGLRAQASA